MSDEEQVTGPLDITTLEVLGQRATSYPLVDRWRFLPDRLSPRRLELQLDAGQYPKGVEGVKLDVRWFEGGCYSFHYIETRGGEDWQCRWDRHPKSGEPNAHFHPPPDAAAPVKPSKLQAHHHLGVLFAVLDWVSERVVSIHNG